MVGLDIVAAHIAGDFLLQSDWMAARKLTCAWTRALHVSAYSLPLALVALLHGSLGPAVLFVALVWISHYVIDSHRWTLGSGWAHKPFVVDQALHLLTLAVLVRLF